MANLNVPVPLALAGGTLCVLGGYVLGAVAGPERSGGESTATVVSWSTSTGELCLSGDAVLDDPHAREGVLCGEWRRGPGAVNPREGQEFRFVTMTTTRASADDAAVYIFGDVVR